MIAFIEEFREEHGVEPICRTLPIAPSTQVTNARLHSVIPRADRRGRDATPS